VGDLTLQDRIRVPPTYLRYPILPYLTVVVPPEVGMNIIRPKIWNNTTPKLVFRAIDDSEFHFGADAGGRAPTST
jgi:hypothetical protein